MNTFVNQSQELSRTCLEPLPALGFTGVLTQSYVNVLSISVFLLRYVRNMANNTYSVIIVLGFHNYFHYSTDMIHNHNIIFSMNPDLYILALI